MTAVVTGATGGIGTEIVRGLLRQGATVVIGVRSRDKGEALRTELAQEPGGGDLKVLPLDIATMSSVREFAATVAKDHPTVQLIVNNAGALFNEHRKTREGHELTLATNVLGPYLLTKLLSPQLQAGKPARVVNMVSSLVGNYDLDDIEWTKRRYAGFKVYAQSKQLLLMITWKLAQQFKNTGVVINAVSPGFVRTGFLDNAKGVMAVFLRLIKGFAVSPQRGAETPLWVATSPEFEGVTGRYFESHKEKNGKYREHQGLDRMEKLLNKMTD